MRIQPARALLGGVLALAFVECIAAAFSYRSRIDDRDWERASTALDPELPVYLATPWLDPVARMELEPIARLPNLGRPDLRGHPRFQVLGLGGDDWSAELEADLEDLPRPRLERSVEAGALTVSTYRIDAGERIDDLLTHVPGLDVETSSGACRGRGPSYECSDRGAGSERVMLDTIEIDYRPRRCIALDVADGREITLRVRDFGLGDVLRGHVGVDDFNARLRSDAVLQLEARVDGRVIARWLFSDDQGWAPFAVATTPGAGTLELVLIPSVRGTWGRDGHRSSPPHRFCVEARSFTEGGA